MAYVALPELKAQLGATATTTHDNVLERLLLASQAAVDTLTNQVWESPASRDEFFVVRGWTSTLDIPAAQSISAVAEKVDGSWSALADDDWDELETSDATETLIRRGCWAQSIYGEASVRVTGVFAKTATVPADIKEGDADPGDPPVPAQGRAARVHGCGDRRCCDAAGEDRP